MATKQCNYCHGGGKITVWDAKARKYVRVRCWACEGKGYIVI